MKCVGCNSAGPLIALKRCRRCYDRYRRDPSRPDATLCQTCFRRPATARGRCDPCYMRFQRQVAAGKTTWSELERNGQVWPSERRSG